LKVGQGDRLVAGAEGVETAEEGDLDQEALPAGGAPLEEPGPKINPCGHCEPPDGVGEETTSNRFGTDEMAEGIYDMDGFGWENSTPLDRGNMTSLTLNITFRRTHRP
jgi:hypothetical protein